MIVDSRTITDRAVCNVLERTVSKGASQDRHRRFDGREGCQSDTMDDRRWGESVCVSEGRKKVEHHGVHTGESISAYQDCYPCIGMNIGQDHKAPLCPKCICSDPKPLPSSSWSLREKLQSYQSTRSTWMKTSSQQRFVQHAPQPRRRNQDVGRR